MITRPKRNWGTQETVNAIRTAAAAVAAKHPDSPKIVVGDLSLPGGGRFPPHKSHQSGRDADIGYYVKGQAPTRLMRVNRNTIDVPRTWTFFESLLKDGKVQFLFVDYRLQKVLYNHAKDVAKVPPEQLAKWFSYPKARVVRGVPIRHLKGHADHMHVRFFNPQAVANFKGYVAHHGPYVLKPVPVHYRVRRGDSLYRIARKFRLKVKQLRKMNRFRRKKTRLRPGQKLVVGYRRPTLPGMPATRKTIKRKKKSRKTVKRKTRKKSRKAVKRKPSKRKKRSVARRKKK
jgi:LysM repeat protein